MATAALSYCAGQVQTHAPDRYLATLLAPAEHREALFALYAFDHEIGRVRRVVHESMVGLIRLQWWRDALDGIAAGQPLEHPVVQGLVAVVTPATRAILEPAIDARERELEDQPFKHLTDLEDHLDLTAGGIARVALQILADSVAGIEPVAARIGRAYGLSQLIHDLPADLDRQRLLLPQDLLVEAGIDSRDMLITGAERARVTTVVGSVAARARDHLATARVAQEPVPEAALPALWPATLAGLRLRRLARAGHDPFAPGLRRPLASAPIRLLVARARKRF